MLQKLFINYSDFNPFDKVTLASACNEDLRKNCMIKNTIASEPVLGWGGKTGNQSTVALQWLHWLDHTLRKQALENLSDEDLEAHDLMSLAYPDHEHPSYRNYVQLAAIRGNTLYQELELVWTAMRKIQTLSTNFMDAFGMAALNVILTVWNAIFVWWIVHLTMSTKSPSSARNN